jgi:hypothetical protein
MSVSLIDNMTKEKIQKFRIVKSWRNNNSEKSTIIFSIPQDLAKQYDISRPANLFLITCENGILLKK